MTKIQTIEINTTQNVIIRYELALLQDRIFAFFLDVFFINLSSLILRLIYALVLPTIGLEWGDILWLLAYGPIFFFYTLLFEGFNHGQTPGKKIVNIKVVKISGDQLKWSDVGIRWMFRLIDIFFSLGSIACLMIGSSTQKQRLGDLLAHTAVVKVAPRQSISLKQLIKINENKEYVPKFPQVKWLKEEEMLLVKAVLKSYEKYKNEAHREAMYELIRKLRDRLAITEEVGHGPKFLQVLLNDYVMLTR